MVSVDTISKKYNIMDPATIAAIVASIGALGSSAVNYFSGRKTQQTQMQHDIEMAERQKKNEELLQKNMFDYQNKFNSWSNNRSQMVEAGFNPALMFGSSASPVTFDASGSASGSSSSLPTPSVGSPFKSVDPFEVVNQQIAQQNANTNESVGESIVGRNNAESLESMARTNRHNFDLKLRKDNEKLIIDTMQAELERISAEGENFRSLARERDTLLEGRKLKLDKETELIVNQIEREPLVRQQISADISRLKSVVKLNQEMATTEGYKRSKMVSEIHSLEESIKGQELENVMKRFGLYQRHKPSDSHRLVTRDGQFVSAEFSLQEQKAFDALVHLGYSLDDASTAVLYYCGYEPKDLTPSVINGASRVLSGLISAAGRAIPTSSTVTKN